MAAVLTENQKTWVAELRSGKYNQTSSALKRVNEKTGEVSFCCLGVASEISGLCTQALVSNSFGSLTTTGSRNIAFTPIDNPDYGGLETYAPVAVLRWLGTRERNGESVSGDVPLDVPREIANLTAQGTQDDPPTFYDPGTIGYLTGAGMNDEGFTFDQIADCIEYFGIAEFA